MHGVTGWFGPITPRGSPAAAGGRWGTGGEPCATMSHFAQDAAASFVVLDLFGLGSSLFDSTAVHIQRSLILASVVVIEVLAGSPNVHPLLHIVTCVYLALDVERSRPARLQRQQIPLAMIIMLQYMYASSFVPLQELIFQVKPRARHKHTKHADVTMLQRD